MSYLQNYIVINEQEQSFYLTLYKGSQMVADIRYKEGKPVYRYIMDESLLDTVLGYEIDTYVDVSDFFDVDVKEELFLSDEYIYTNVEDKTIGKSPATQECKHFTSMRNVGVQILENIVSLSGAVSNQPHFELN